MKYLPIQTTHLLQLALGGNPQDEEDVVNFIQGRYRVRALNELPERIAKEAIRRPQDFLNAARKWKGEPF